ncbi:MAG TPA: AraC family transcriptional regulator [Candidatus Polarisedimenticolaceae bacterium]|nr:AraC family transcriptional regulator [Candidatus Polarisedimenticolaceae bacterium]
MSSALSEPTYLVRVATLLLDDAARVGVNRERLVRRLVIDEATLRNPDARMPLSTLVAIVRAVLDEASDPAFGVRAGSARRARDAGLIGYAMLHSTTLRDALSRLARYGRIVGDQNRFELQDGTIVFESHPGLESIPEIVELNLAWIVAVLREIAGRDIVPAAVRFPAKEPEHVQALHAHFRCPLEFDVRPAAIVMHGADLDTTVASADATLVGYLDKLADEAVRALGANTTTGRLRQVLWSRLSAGAPTLDAAAATMAMSPRTLQRRLADEGTTFADALGALRHDLAAGLLDDPKLAVYEVGFLLGYADQSAFHRAFRRWYGMSPRRFREKSRRP